MRRPRRSVYEAFALGGARRRRRQVRVRRSTPADIRRRGWNHPTPSARRCPRTHLAAYGECLALGGALRRDQFRSTSSRRGSWCRISVGVRTRTRVRILVRVPATAARTTRPTRSADGASAAGQDRMLNVHDVMPDVGVVQADWDVAMASSAGPTGGDDNRRTKNNTDTKDSHGKKRGHMYWPERRRAAAPRRPKRGLRSSDGVAPGAFWRRHGRLRC